MLLFSGRIRGRPGEMHVGCVREAAPYAPAQQYAYALKGGL